MALQAGDSVALDKNNRSTTSSAVFTVHLEETPASASAALGDGAIESITSAARRMTTAPPLATRSHHACG